MKMKFIPFVLLFVCLFNGASGQDLRIGLRGGLNLSTFVGDNADDANIRAGLHLGPYIKYGINDQIFFQPELLFSMKGFSEKGKVSTGDFKFKQRLIYLDLPLIAGINITENIHALVGLQPSFLLGAKAKINYENEDAVFQDDKDNNTEEYANIDLGLILGVQYAMESGLDLGFRFTYGFPNVFDDKNPTAHNLNLMLTAGYTIAR